MRRNLLASACARRPQWLGPEEPFGDKSREDMETDYWSFPQPAAEEKGVAADVAEVRPGCHTRSYSSLDCAGTPTPHFTAGVPAGSVAAKAPSASHLTPEGLITRQRDSSLDRHDVASCPESQPCLAGGDGVGSRAAAGLDSVATTPVMIPCGDR